MSCIDCNACHVMSQMFLVRDERVKGEPDVILDFAQLSAGLRPLPPEVLFFFQDACCSLRNRAANPSNFTVVSCSWQSPVKAACAVPYIARPVSYCSGISIGSCKVADPNRLYRRSAVEVQSFSDGGWY